MKTPSTTTAFPGLGRLVALGATAAFFASGTTGWAAFGYDLSIDLSNPALVIIGVTGDAASFTSTQPSSNFQGINLQGFFTGSVTDSGSVVGDLASAGSGVAYTDFEAAGGQNLNLWTALGTPDWGGPGAQFAGTFAALNLSGDVAFFKGLGLGGDIIEQTSLQKVGTWQVTAAAVPELSSTIQMSMLGVGCAAFVIVRQQRRKATATA